MGLRQTIISTLARKRNAIVFRIFCPVTVPIDSRGSFRPSVTPERFCKGLTSHVVTLGH